MGTGEPRGRDARATRATGVCADSGCRADRGAARGTRSGPREPRGRGLTSPGARASRCRSARRSGTRAGAGWGTAREAPWRRARLFTSQTVADEQARPGIDDFGCGRREFAKLAFSCNSRPRRLREEAREGDGGMPSSALLASRARTRATTGHLSPPRARGVDRRRRRQRTKGAPRVASGLQPRRGKQRKERASRGWHRPGVMFKRLFGAKDAGGGVSAAPTGGGGGAGGKNTLSAVEKLKDVRAPAPTSRDRVPPRSGVSAEYRQQRHPPRLAR